MSENKMQITVDLNTRPAIDKAKKLQSDINKAIQVDTKGNEDLIKTQQNLEKVSVAANDAARAFSNYYAAVGKLRAGLQKAGYSSQDLDAFIANKADLEKEKARLEKAWSLKWQDKPESRGAQNNRADLANVEKKLSFVQSAENLQKMGVAANEFYSRFAQAGTIANDLTQGIANVSGSMGVLTEVSENFVTSETKANEVINQTTEAASGLTESVTKLNEASAKGAGLDNVAEVADKAKDKMLDLKATIIGIKSNVMTVAESMKMTPATDNIAELIRRFNTLKDVKREIESMKMPKDLDGTYATTLRLLEQLSHQISIYKQNLASVDTEQKKTSGSTNVLANAYKILKSNLSTIKNAFKNIHGVIKKMRSAFTGLSKDMHRSFKQNLTRITKYVLGFRSLFFLVRRLRKYLGEGIQNLVQFNNGNNAVNASITRLLSSLLYLKNAWAAAFSPIITYVTSWLEALIDKMAVAGNAVARFIGALTGQTVVFNAVKVQAQDYASTLDNVGSSASGAADKAKKLKDRLAAFDDLNVLGKDDDTDGTGGGGGGGLADAYTPDPNDMFTIVEAQSELADKIKKAWEESGFFGIGHLISQSIAEWLGNIDWENFKEEAGKLGMILGEFFKGLFGNPEFWSNLGDAAAGLLNGLIYAIKGFLDANAGTHYGKMIAEGFNNFLNNTDWKQAGLNLHDFCTGILTNIKEFFDTEDPKALASSIHDFLEGVNIADIIWKLGQVIVSAAKVIIQVTAELVIDWGEDLGEWLYEQLGGDEFAIKVNFVLDAKYGQESSLENLYSLLNEAQYWGDVLKALLLGDPTPFQTNILTEYWHYLSEGWTAGWTEFENLIWGDENWEGGIAEWLTDLLGFDELYDWAKSGGTDVTTGFWDGIKEGWNNFWDWFTGLFDGLKTWVEECFDIHSPSGVFEGYGINIMDGLWNGLSVAWENVKLFFSNIKTWISDTWTNIKNKTAEVWNNIKNWLSDTWESIKTKVSSTFTVIKSKILYIWESIKEGIKTPINAILGVIESFVNKCIDGINSLIEKLNSIPDIKITNPFNGQEYTLGLNIPTIKNISIPRLAQGAVIPPNREFMAVLGDQSHGTNIEAPLDTIKQAVAEVLANNGNAEVIRLLQQLIGVVESKELVIGDKDIGKANARYTAQQQLIRGVSF